MSVEEHNLKRKTNAQQGYTLYLNRNEVLDCYDAAHAGICDAMMANSPLNVRHSITGIVPVANAKLVNYKGMVYLVSLVDIGPNTEILYRYGTVYRDY